MYILVSVGLTCVQKMSTAESRDRDPHDSRSKQRRVAQHHIGRARVTGRSASKRPIRPKMPTLHRPQALLIAPRRESPSRTKQRRVAPHRAMAAHRASGASVKWHRGDHSPAEHQQSHLPFAFCPQRLVGVALRS